MNQYKIPKEGIIKGLTTICQYFADEGKLSNHDYDSIESLVDAMCTDKFVEYININAEDLYVADAYYDVEDHGYCQVRCSHLSKYISNIESDMYEDELHISDDLYLFPRIWPKPAVAIGGAYSNICLNPNSDIPKYESWIMTYMDSDGKIFGVYEMEVNDKGCSFMMRQLLKDGEFELNIGTLIELLSDEYHGLFIV